MFDLNKIKTAAKKLGLELKFNSENPGMHFVKPEGDVEIYTYDNLQKSLNDEFKVHSTKMNIHYNLNKNSSIKLNIQSEENKKKTTHINKIKVSIGVYNKTSEKVETSYKIEHELQESNYYKKSTIGAA